MSDDPPIPFPYVFANSYTLEIAMVVVSIVTSFNGFIQWAEIRRTDTSLGISPVSWAFSAVGNLIWTVYSLALRDVAVFISSLVPFLGAMFVLYEVYMRRNRTYSSV